MSEYPEVTAELLHMGGRFKDIDQQTVLLKLTTFVKGVKYQHLAGLPPMEHVTKFPDSLEDAQRGAFKRLQEKVDRGADQP